MALLPGRRTHRPRYTRFPPRGRERERGKSAMVISGQSMARIETSRAALSSTAPLVACSCFGYGNRQEKA